MVEADIYCGDEMVMLGLTFRPTGIGRWPSLEPGLLRSLGESCLTWRWAQMSYGPHSQMPRSNDATSHLLTASLYVDLLYPRFHHADSRTNLARHGQISASTRQTSCRPTLLLMSASTLAPSPNGRARCSHHVAHIRHARRLLHLREDVELEGSTWHWLFLACSVDCFCTIASSAVEALSPFVSSLEVPPDSKSELTLLWNPSQVGHMFPSS